MQSIWKLPENFTVGELNNSPEVAAEGEEQADDVEFDVEDGTNLIPVEGLSNWRMVQRGTEKAYYFHIITQETSWELPPSN